MKKNIPTFQFVIDDSSESGVKAISIVGDPAFQSSMITFSAERPKFVVLAKNKKKQICAGLSLIPDVPIYRVDEFGNEYYGYFSKETIERIVEKYHMEMNQNKLNLNHDENKYIDAFMIEDYIVNSNARVSDLKEKGIEHKNIEGAWYTAFKIQDPQVFEAISNGTSTAGFSVEAYLNTFSVRLNKNDNNMKKEKKSLLEKIISIFGEDQKFERALVPELGFEIEWGVPGEPVNKVEVDPNGNEVLSPVGPGEFKTDMGTIIVNEASQLVEVTEPAPEPEPVPEVPVEEPVVEEVPVVSGDTETMAEEVPAIVPEGEVVVPEVPDVKSKTIGELVGESDGEFWIKVVVSGGEITEAEVSSETDLMKTKLAEVEKENDELKKKLEEPIGEPILQPEVKVKPFAEMSAYEKALHNAQMRRG
jgi:hypothetical protein